MERILAQLKQRQIFKVATIYAVSAWPLIQIADLAVPALGLPDSVMTLLLKIFIVGFPVSLIFAWLFNFTKKGIVRAQSDASNDDGKNVNIRTTIAIAGSLFIALIITLTSQVMMDDNQSPLLNASTDTVPAPPVEQVFEQVKKETIAVLPFVPFSADPEDEYFADGMVEELLNLLAKIPDLQVAARTSSFAYKGVKNKNIVQIGKELGVETILEGSIRKNDTTNRIRVTAQLIKVNTGEHLWSETYDKEYRDIFQIQDDIARAVVDKMKVTLLGQAQQTQFVVGTESVDAMVEYGKGQKELAHRTAPSITKALQHFSNAATEDSNYARAFVGIADANVLLALYGSLPKAQAIDAAQKAIDKALTLNDQLAAAHASQGLLLTSTDPIKAVKSFNRAIELNPSYAMTYMWYGSLKQESGDLAGAHQLFEKAHQLDPKSPVAAYNVAWCYYQVGAEDKAMELFTQIIGNDPYYPGAYNLAGDILLNRGRLDESISMYNRALEVDPLNIGAVNGLIIANMDMGNVEDTKQLFTYIEQSPSLFSVNETLLMKARFSATQGDKAQAIKYLSLVENSDTDMGLSLYIKGEQAYYSGNYAEAVNTFEGLKDSPASKKNFFFHMAEGQAVSHLSYAYQQIEKSEKADALLNEFEQYLQSTTKKNIKGPIFYYNMALIKILQNRTNESFNYLQGAIDAGWIQVWKAKIEPIFEPIKQQEQFLQMIGGVEARLLNMRTRMQEDKRFFLTKNDF